jgi:hypothetical protein
MECGNFLLTVEINFFCAPVVSRGKNALGAGPDLLRRGRIGLSARLLREQEGDRAQVILIPG